MKNQNDQEKRSGVYSGYEDYNEEYAMELTKPLRPAERMEKSPDTGGKIAGYTALGFSILSLFTAPAFFGITGIVLGLVARGRGGKSTGNWAIGIGILSVVTGLFIAPFF